LSWKHGGVVRATYTAKRCRPLFRRFLRTRRPFLLAILDRKP
jgi:hypothetical protein